MRSSLLFVLFLSFSISCFAQKQTLTGTIYDETKNVLADVNVAIKNTDTGKITSKNGMFTLQVKPKDILVISYLGYKTKEIVVGQQKNITVVLKPSLELLDAVVLTGYPINIKKEHIITCHFIEHTWGCGVTAEENSGRLERAPKEQCVISLFPNPSANGLFQLQLANDYTKLTLEIYSMNGQLIKSYNYSKLSKTPQINLSKQPKGMYLIKVIVDGKVLKTKKAIRS